jgi:hypothetical protein
MAQNGTRYAPKIFKRKADLQGVATVAELEEAMTRLIDTKQIENVPYGPLSKGAFRLLIPGMDAMM